MTKQDLRIVFLGTPDFAVESLNRLVEGGYNVVGVITMPDKPAGRGHHLLQSAVKQYAVAQDLKVMQPVSLRDPEFLEELRSLRADLFIVIAFRMLPREVWQMPPLGTFNLHASLLPRYRGAAPINRAVMNGDTETGVTTFMLKHEIDTGDILQQQSIQIADDENVGSVHDRLMMLGAELTIQTVDHIIAGDLTPIPQDQLLGEREATPAPKIFSDDCVIDWTKPATEVHNHVRGLSPYPAARSVLLSADGSELSCKILATRKVEGSPDAQPGHILCADKKLVVACADSTAVEVLRIQPAGKKAMDTEAWLRGFRLAQDAQFVEKLGK